MTLQKFTENKKHIIWDWNGTLLDDVSVCVEVINEVLTQNELKNIDENQYRKHFRFPIVDYYKSLGFDFEKVCFKEVAKQFITTYESRVRECSLRNNIKSTLLDLKNNRFNLSVLSAAQESQLVPLIEHHEIDHLFDHIFGLADHYAASKVERGKQLMKTAGTDPSTCLLIGDTDHDAEVAAEIGIDYCLVTDGHQCKTRLASHQDRHILL